MTSEELNEIMDCLYKSPLQRRLLNPAYKAMQKQIPKKMLKEHYSGFTLDVCPNCKTSFGGFGNINGYEYCPHCGQNLVGWKDDE